MSAQTDLRDKIKSLDVLRLITGISVVCKKPLVEFVERYPILFGPVPTDREGEIKYSAAVRDLFKEGEIICAGALVYEAKPNQRKFLILRYFSKVNSGTSKDVSSSMNITVSNASRRLKLYYLQGLFNRSVLVDERRGRPTMVYKLTEKGRKRLDYLSKNVYFRREETMLSRVCHLGGLRWDKVVKELLYQT